MSTDYRLHDRVSKQQVIDAAIKAGLTVDQPKEVENTFSLTDGKVYLWAYYDDDGEVHSFTRYGDNYDASEVILSPIAKELNTSYISEHDEGYYPEGMEDDEDPMGSDVENGPKDW